MFLFWATSFETYCLVAVPLSASELSLTEVRDKVPPLRRLDPGLMPLPDTACGLEWASLVNAAKAYEGEEDSGKGYAPPPFLAVGGRPGVAQRRVTQYSLSAVSPDTPGRQEADLSHWRAHKAPLSVCRPSVVLRPVSPSPGVQRLKETLSLIYLPG